MRKPDFLEQGNPKATPASVRRQAIIGAMCGGVLGAVQSLTNGGGWTFIPTVLVGAAIGAIVSAACQWQIPDC